MIDKLEILEKKDPTEYWSILNKLKTMDDDTRVNPIPMEEWVQYCSKLLGTPNIIIQYVYYRSR